MPSKLLIPSYHLTLFTSFQNTMYFRYLEFTCVQNCESMSNLKWTTCMSLPFIQRNSYISIPLTTSKQAGIKLLTFTILLKQEKSHSTNKQNPISANGSNLNNFLKTFIHSRTWGSKRYIDRKTFQSSPHYQYLQPQRYRENWKMFEIAPK